MKKLDLAETQTSIDYAKMEPECVGVVKYFNENGLPTEMSCQGHEQLRQSLFWVSFRPEVDGIAIAEFQQRHLDMRGHFCSCGHFGQRLFVFTDETKGCPVTYTVWEYVASSYKAAQEDLRTWQLLSGRA